MQRKQKKEHEKHFRFPREAATNNNSDAPVCRRFIVTGRVQGVWFRASTRDVAARLSLSGYAKNLPDGNVEVVACGEADSISELAAWLRRGPRMASVTSVDEEQIEYRRFKGFATA